MLAPDRHSPDQCRHNLLVKFVALSPIVQKRHSRAFREALTKAFVQLRLVLHGVPVCIPLPNVGNCAWSKLVEILIHGLMNAQVKSMQKQASTFSIRICIFHQMIAGEEQQMFVGDAEQSIIGKYHP